MTLRHNSTSPRPMWWWQARWGQVLRGLCQRVYLQPLSLLCRPLRVEGTANLAIASTAILVANHSSHLDTLLILRALPGDLRRRVAVAAAADYFFSSPLKGAAVSVLMNAFPFRRTGGCRESLRTCEELLGSGWWLLIYPEGTRSLDGEVGAFQRGVGRLAAQTGAPLVPVHIEGAHAALPKGSCVPNRAPVTVRFGRPRRYAQDADERLIADDLRSRVVALGAPTSEPHSLEANGGQRHGHAA